MSAILFPVFASAREKARQSTCTSNLKQIGLGLTQYSQDYDETAISPWYSNQVAMTSGGTLVAINGSGLSNQPGFNGNPKLDGVNNYTWIDAVYPYIKSIHVFDCPSQLGTSNFPGQSIKVPITAQGYNGSYAINTMYTRCPNSPCSMGWTGSLSKVVSPSQTIWVSDSIDAAGFENYMDTIGGNYNPYFNPAGTPVKYVTYGVPVPVAGQGNVTSGTTYALVGNGLLAFLHSEQTDAVFADGHVKSLTYGAVQANTSTTKSCQNNVTYAAEVCYASLMAY
jgi:prepilin-type processing-associated H-X9-DG protein